MPHNLRVHTLRAACLCVLAAATYTASAQVVRVPLPHSDFLISQGVWVGDTYYMSGTGDHMAGKPGGITTEDQTEHTLESIQQGLAAQHLTMGDVVMMHVYLAPDPATGKCDFAGFMKSYVKFFGTKDQPNKPARSAVQVGALVIPGGMVEIEVIAARSK